MEERKVVIVGGGVAGLMCAIKLAEKEIPVQIFSPVRLRRSYSVCTNDGINAALNTKGEEDSVERHVEDTMSVGGSLAQRDIVFKMCKLAPGLVYLFERMGTPFNRTPEGCLDLRLSAEAGKRRNVYSENTTGQQMLSVLDSQVRKFEVPGLIKRREFWHPASFVKESNGRCVGITAIDMRNMDVKSFSAAAVVLSSGGYGGIFGKSHIESSGSPATEAYKQGALMANPEFVKLDASTCYSMGGLYVNDDHMTTIPGLFAVGECNYLYHGAGCLSGNVLLSEAFSGFQAGEYLPDHVYEAGSEKTGDALFEEEIKKQSEQNKNLALQEGEENVYRLKGDLEEIMCRNFTGKINNSKLRKASEDIQVLMERYQRCGSADTSKWVNKEVLIKRDFQNMLQLAHVVTEAALARDESRGAHRKEGFPNRDDENWKKITKVEYSPEKPKLSYEEL